MFRSLLVAVCGVPMEAFCPAGFANPDQFMPEWQIPEWPKDLPDIVVMSLRTVSLGGFDNTDINEEYLEGPSEEFHIQGRQTYWQASGNYFLFYCKRFRKWRVAGTSKFSANKDGECFGFISDAFIRRDLFNETLLSGFLEVVDGDWVFQEDAGVKKIGTMAEQLASLQDEDCEDSDEKKKSGGKCPMRAVGNSIKDAAVSIGKWVRRLFPKYLGAPEEDAAEAAEAEEAAPEADPAEAGGAASAADAAAAKAGEAEAAAEKAKAAKHKEAKPAGDEL